MSINAALDSYATYTALSDAILSAINDKSVLKWRSPHDFKLLYEELEKKAANHQKLHLISTLGRLEAILKKPVFDPAKVRVLLSERPNFDCLTKGDDRYYAALFIRRLSPDWVESWALSAAWQEPDSEKVRFVAVDIIIEKATSLDSALSQLGIEGLRYIKAEKLDEPKATAKVVRVTKVVRAVCNSRIVNCSAGVGSAIDSFAGAPFSHFFRDDIKLNVRKSLIPEIIGLLLDLISQRFSLATGADYYVVLKRVRKWCDQDNWQKLSKKYPSLERLSNSISEALLILARQGVTDQRLILCLKASVDDVDCFKDYCRKIAADIYIEDAIAAWFIAGGSHPKIRKTISAEDDLVAKVEAEDVGELLLRVQQLREALELAEQALVDIELFDPSLARVIKGLVNHCAMMEDVSSKIAAKRSVKLSGGLGEEVDIDRKLYEVIEEGGIPNRKGVVIRSAVIYSAKGGRKVIKKGVLKTSGSEGIRDA